MTDYTRDEEYEIVDKLIAKHTCRIIKSEVDPYTLFHTKDIAHILQLKSIRSHLRFYPDNMTKKLNYETNGGYQNCKFLTLLGLIRLLVRTRKPEAITLANDIGIIIERRKFTCTETDCIECIKKAFVGEEMVEQYQIGRYRVDLYFPRWKLIIECDENEHKYNTDADANREKNIKDLSNDCSFIRFCPDNKDFCIFNVINQIINFRTKRSS